MPASSAAQATLDGLVTSFRYHKDLADRAIAQLPDEQLHIALDPNTNSMAVIVQHIAGNLRSRWTDFLTSDGEKPWRDRDGEFIDERRSRDELLGEWERGWTCLFEALRALGPDDLAATVLIRGEGMSAALAACRSLAHTSYHVGQIVLIARILAARAGLPWRTLTIPRAAGASQEHNRRAWGQPQYAVSPVAEAESREPTI